MGMKKSVVVCLGIALVASSAFATGGGIMVGGGLTWSDLSISDNLKSDSVVDYTYKSLRGINLHWNYWYKFTDKIGIISGINYESGGSTIHAKINRPDSTFGKDTSTYTSDHGQLHYVFIPIYGTYTVLSQIVPGFISNLTLSLGPEIRLMARVLDKEAPKDIFTSNDIGVSLNCFVELFNMFSLGGGYEQGLTNISNVTGTSRKNHAIKVFINYIHRAKNRESQ
jgi:hypothetical protein